MKQEGIISEEPLRSLEKEVSSQTKQSAPRDQFLHKNGSVEYLTHVSHSAKWCRGCFQWATSGRVHIWAVDKQEVILPYHGPVQCPFVHGFAFCALSHMTNRGLEIVNGKPQKQVLKLEVAFLPT